MRKFLLAFFALFFVSCSTLPFLTKIEVQSRRDEGKGEPTLYVGGGSGFFVNSNIIVTAAHVVDGKGDKFFVYTDNNQSFGREAYVMVRDDDVDIAVLRLPAGRGEPLKFCASAKPKEKIVAHAWRKDNRGVRETTVGEVVGIPFAGVVLGKIITTFGYSGGPVLSLKRGCVMGITSKIAGSLAQPMTVMVRPEASEEVMKVLKIYAWDSVKDLYKDE